VPEFDLDKASIVPTGRNFAPIGLNVEQFVAWIVVVHVAGVGSPPRYR
jgi:hypothetical protein